MSGGQRRDSGFETTDSLQPYSMLFSLGKSYGHQWEISQDREEQRLGSKWYGGEGSKGEKYITRYIFGARARLYLCQEKGKQE